MEKNIYRLLRIAKGIRAVELAAALNIDSSTLSCIETGKRNVSISFRTAYINFFGVDDEFIDKINSEEYQQKSYSDLLMIVLQELKKIKVSTIAMPASNIVYQNMKYRSISVKELANIFFDLPPNKCVRFGAVDKYGMLDGCIPVICQRLCDDECSELDADVSIKFIPLTAIVLTDEDSDIDALLVFNSGKLVFSFDNFNATKLSFNDRNKVCDKLIEFLCYSLPNDLYVSTEINKNTSCD